MQGVGVIKNFNKQKFFSTINQLIYGSYQDKIYVLGKINVRLGLFAGIAGVFFLVIILSVSSFQVYNGELKLGELMALLGIASALLPSVANLALVTIPVNEALIAFDRMFEFISIKGENNDGLPIQKFNSLKFENVSFRFIGRKQVLKNISIAVNENELISIVGESGSGKSTFGQIVQRFYEKECGKITINGNYKFEDIQLNSWRSLLGVVPQDIHLFNGTVLDNIGLNETVEEAEQIISFCKEMGFSDFIEKLPQSYLTIVGETGINLSGGQKQIIALARVLYRRPQLLLLDEATAAMDRITEKFVLNLLVKLKEEMTVIFISHRLHVLKNISDRIYVLENGEVAASGNHEDLLLTSNLYSDYWSELAYV
jgi:ATP-binding cassette subfamily B protein